MLEELNKRHLLAHIIYLSSSNLSLLLVVCKLLKGNALFQQMKAVGKLIYY